MKNTHRFEIPVVLSIVGMIVSDRLLIDICFIIYGAFNAALLAYAWYLVASGRMTSEGKLND